MQALYDFVQYNCDTYGIDESHGLKHAMGTVTWAERLMAGLVDIGADERQLVIYAAALHDMCDSKYRESYVVACAEIRVWLLTQGLADELISALIAIITTMSYTKLKQLATGYPDHGKWTRAYHIIRHADLLEGYKVSRCYLYSVRRLPGASEDELWRETEKVFNERIFKYVSDGWLFLPAALAFIPDLEVEARRCLRERDATYVV
jgi:hypothetical protein